MKYRSLSEPEADLEGGEQVETVVLLVLTVGFNTVSQILFKGASGRSGGGSLILIGLGALSGCGWVLSYVRLLRRMELKVAYPAFMGLAFVVMVVVSWLMFKEEVSYKVVMGVTLVVAGVVVATWR